VIHPDVAARFPLLDGLTSMREAYGTPDGLERIRAYESWEPADGPPSVDVRDDAAPGPHGRVPVGSTSRRPGNGPGGPD
jgi:acetyl esterase